MENYGFLDERLEFLPRGLCFFGGGSGGGTTTQSTEGKMMPWSQYVPPETYEAYKLALPRVGAKFDTGLTPEEKAQYRGEIMTSTGQKFAGAEKELTENLARSGVRGGARAEALSDLARSKAVTGSMGLAGLSSMDIQKKQQNLEEIRKWVGLPGAPIQTGSTSVSKSTPAGGGT